MRSTIIALTAAALAVPAAAFAQSGTTADTARGPVIGDWEFTLSGSGTANNDFDDHTLGASGSVGKYLHQNVLVGVRQSINFNDVEGSDDVYSGSTRGFADYVFDFGNWRPYVGLNLGGIYGEGVNETFAAGGQVGVKYYADQRTFIFAQTEYQFTFDDLSDADNSSNDGQFSHAIGIGMNF
ncbi:MAG: hypothetical protein GEU92_04775 [Alphaproteobacteria bacterium]|nr:hypothetical protein [Alphaproteobacteria bacterium]